MLRKPGTLSASLWERVAVRDNDQLSAAFWSLQLWVEERLPLAQSADYGTNLQTVQLFMKKNQVGLISAVHLPLLSAAWPQGVRPGRDVQKAGDSTLLLLMVAFQSSCFA